MNRIIALLTALLAIAPAHAETWRMLEDSEFLFEATWEDTALPGRFRAFDVTLETDTGDIADARLAVTVDLAAADMDDPDINEAIAGDDWFAVAKHPRATYTSQSILELAPGEYRAAGELVLKGVARAIEVPFAWSESDSRAEMNGELVVDRTQFDIGSGEWANDDSIGVDVRLSFTVLLAEQ